jgi:polysulfide reductase chain C
MIWNGPTKRYIRQKEWIEGRGLFIACAFFFGGISGGLYLASLFFDNILGEFVSWLLALMMGACYMIHLTRPFRAWRMIFRPGTSWISRGFTFISLFILFVLIQISLSFWFPGSAGEVILKVFGGIAALAQVMYTGFVLSYITAIKFWNSALIPVLFLICALSGGTGILLGINLVGTGTDVKVLEDVIRILLIVYAVVLVVYLWNSIYTDRTAKHSVMSLLKGNNALIFWAGVILLGIVIPLAITFISYATNTESSALLFIAIICEIMGGFSLRYSILKAGIYSPVVNH